MSFPTYAEAHAAVMAHFQQGRFAEALAALDAARPVFQANQTDIDYLRTCLAVRLEQPDLAYQILDDLLAEGTWFAEELFRQSPSYAPLQGDPAFEARVQMHERMRQAQAARQKSLFTLTPAAPPEPRTSLLLHLHGNGSQAEQEIPHWQAAAELGWHVAAPASPHQLWAGGGAFWPDHAAARAGAQQALDPLAAETGLATERALLTGFSMGGEAAIVLALAGDPLPAAGFIAIAPGGPLLEDPAQFEPLIAAAVQAGRSLRGALLLSENDPHIDPAAIQKLAALLNAGGIPCDLAFYPATDHVFPADMRAALQRALAFIFPPPAGLSPNA